METASEKAAKAYEKFLWSVINEIARVWDEKGLAPGAYVEIDPSLQPYADRYQNDDHTIIWIKRNTYTVVDDDTQDYLAVPYKHNIVDTIYCLKMLEGNHYTVGSIFN